MSHNKKYLFASLLLFSLLALVTPKGGHGFDNSCWTLWATYIFENGLGNVYNSDTNYLPLYHYILKVYGTFSGSAEAISANIYYLKFVTLLFHFITGYFVFLLIKKDNKGWDNALVNSLFYLLNIAVLYNGIIWGQVDIIVACFAFISCYLALQKKITLSLVFLLLAVNFKLQAIIFFPVIGLILLPEMVLNFSYRKLALWLLVPLAIQLLIFMPFIAAGTFPKLYTVVRSSVGKCPVVSLNAFNLWYLLLPGDLIKVRDHLPAFGMSYKNWGLVFFFFTSAMALFPLIKTCYSTIVTKSTQNVLPINKILIVASLIPLLFFYFNTQMHERYAHPAFAFLIVFCIRERKPLLAITGCLAYLLNLEAVLMFFDLPDYNVFIFDRRIISLLWLFTIVGLFMHLYDLRLTRLFKTQAVKGA